MIVIRVHYDVQRVDEITNRAGSRGFLSSPVF